MSNFDHFHPDTPQAIREKLLGLAEYVKDNFNYGKAESYGSTNLDEIYGIDPGGFIPYQRGGYEVSDLIQCDQDSSYHVSQGMTDFQAGQGEECFKWFLEDNDIDSLTTYDELTEERKNELSDYEKEWFKPALLRFECWLDDPNDEENWRKGTGNVFMRLSVNYSDAPYYRANRDETLHKLSLSTDEFLKAKPEELWQKLLTMEAGE